MAADQRIGFGVCANCGMILQSTTPTMDEVIEHYKNAATYTNDGRLGKPSKMKVAAVSRQIGCILKDINVPESVFQVGCSDGYTLSQFVKRGSSRVSGIDPSNDSHKLAKKLYRIDTIVGTLEEHSITESNFQLVVLTHVLEHLFDPIEALKKCRDFLVDGGWLLIEVPLFEDLTKLPPGLLTYEHLNYFTEGTLIQAVMEAGFSVNRVEKDYDSDEYPVITLSCQIDKDSMVKLSQDYVKNRSMLLEYMDNEKRLWGSAFSRIKSELDIGSTVYIYGAGIHTSQLFANTQIEDYLNIVGLLDSAPKLWGSKFGPYVCINPQEASRNVEAIIISSFASEIEIYEYLIDEKYDTVFNLIRLYS